MMSEENRHRLQVLLYETGNKELRETAAMLSDPTIDMGLRRQTDKRLYRALRLLIDENSYKNLLEADKRINKIWNKVFANGGWYLSRLGATQIDNEDETMQTFPHEVVEGRRLYHLDRDETGYHTQDFEPEENTIYFYARQTEEEFMKERKVELALAHQLYTLKEQIMGGEYQLQDPSYAPIVELISEYFGYNPEPKKVPTK